MKGLFALSRLLVTDFLLFNVLFQSSVKMFKVPGFQVLGSWVLGPGVPGPVPWIPSSGFLKPDSRVLGSLVLGHGCWGPGLGSCILSLRFWVLILDFALFNQVEGLRTCNFVEKRFQHRSFSVNIAKFLKMLILKKICWRLLPNKVKRNYSSMKTLK